VSIITYDLGCSLNYFFFKQSFLYREFTRAIQLNLYTKIDIYIYIYIYILIVNIIVDNYYISSQFSDFISVTSLENKKIIQL
jgi:hypothetical protein